VSPFLRPGLRYPRLWFCIGLLIVAFITVTCLMPAKDVPDTGIPDKVIHAFSYAVLASWYASVVQRRHFLALLLVLTAFGGLIELAQAAMQLGRHAEWLDLLADVVGSALGIALAATPLGRWPELLESMIRRVLA
jgi:VanZ family protein